MGDWNVELYKERVSRWQKAADELPPGAERDACLSLAEGYFRLIKLIAKSEPLPDSRKSKRPEVL